MNSNACRTDNGPMLNAYPDSLGGALGDIVSLLQRPELEGAFSSFYILPSLFHSDLDRGFSVVDYGLNEQLARREDLDALRALGVDLKLDFILNHASVRSAPFQDLLLHGEQSRYRDFFLDWNKFWEGCGPMTEAGYIQPDEKWIGSMFFRKPGLPLLMVRFPDGREVPYWNTFYQEVRYAPLTAAELLQKAPLSHSDAEQVAALVREALENKTPPAEISFGQFAFCRACVLALLEQRRSYLGQMDLNIRSPLVWEFYEETLHTLAGYGASIVRLDAFAYAPKEPGARNFLNEPGTWELLQRVRTLADGCGVTLLPEIHASYAEGTYALLAQKGYLTYDFFLPGLMLDALERGRGEMLCRWAQELQEKHIRVVNMLGCHDGIPLLDLQGLLPEERIQALVALVVARGGFVKNLHGQKNLYYQVNAAYFSALGESEQKLLLARALQLFMPGKPQVWYLDLFAGKNDHEAVARAGAGGHKEINRTNLTAQQISDGLAREVVLSQLALLRWRSTFPAFGFDAAMQFCCPTDSTVEIIWRQNGCTATLCADLCAATFVATGTSADGTVAFHMER